MANELDNQIKSYATDYWNEFLTADLDSEWSATAYEDLGGLKDEIDWDQFHTALQYQISQIEVLVEPVTESENITDGLFINF